MQVHKNTNAASDIISLQQYLLVSLKLWQNKKGWNLFEMPTKNDVFFSAAICKKDIIFGGHLKQISALLILLGL